MANEYIDQLRPFDLAPINGPIVQRALAYSGGTALVPGLRLPKSDTQGYFAQVYVPHNLTIATGFIFNIGVTDDGTDADDLSKVVRFGITVKALASGTDNLTITGAATEQTVDVTLNGTSGVLVTGALSIANANLDGVATGTKMLVRLRRIGTASQDTCRGAVLVTLFDIRNT